MPFSCTTGWQRSFRRRTRRSSDSLPLTRAGMHPSFTAITVFGRFVGGFGLVGRRFVRGRFTCCRDDFAGLDRLIADGEYSAAKKYQTLVCTFADVRSVMEDESRHGDTVMALI